ncbi:type I pullulanase [Clostridium sp. CS001]|uniref:type I pullulanase n=1 Tax=Clostridium sp. CS001 TaxID=2880648 RepID=UPI001CF5AEC4|nr:type I pullulanase [Clostridium sp. CS001]MCB2288163.1 type I pullulanase [Clostridium sp. CS001]
MEFKTEITNRKALSVFLAGTLVMTELFFLVPNTKTYAENAKTKTLTVVPPKGAVIPIKPSEKLGEFVVAKLDDMNIITIETNLILSVTSDISYGITVKENGNIIKIKKVTSSNKLDSTKTFATIELSENVKLGSKLTILKDGFKEKEVVMGDVLGSANFEKLFYYEGNDLGNTYSVNKTSFKVWSPTATEVSLVSYKNWNDKIGVELAMKKGEKGTWTFDFQGDQKGTFYTYKVKFGEVLNEVVDPYARAVSVNGDRAAIIDLKETNPNVWKLGEKPNFINMNDAIIYELHVRDFSIDENSGMVNKGKFLAFTETVSKGSDGKPTGIDYIKNLGVTHVQLLPIMDYASVDETSIKPQFSWGYDTKNYNVPEGSYSTDAYNPNSRIKELKQAVQSFHNSGLRVIMDVSYSNIYSNANSNLNKLVPGYFFRDSKNAANSSEKGAVITSENAMTRKFIVDSVMYWAKEYNLDGFRFNLMGELDVKTMNEIRKKTSSLDPSILIIGEELNSQSSKAEDTKASQNNASKMPGITHFNHITRDGIKGEIFHVKSKGFVNGKVQSEIDIKKGIVGGIEYSSDIKTWGKIEPVQSINYAEDHSNNTLWDKLLIANPKDNEATRTKMHRIADAIVLTSQGIPFFQAGQEFLRTKGGNANSYKSPDSVNMIDWTRKSQNTDTVDYFKGLIELRKAHPAFRMTSADMITKNLNFLVVPENVVAYEMNYNANMDSWDNIVVAFNANKEDKIIKLSKKGTWNIVVNGEKAGVETIKQFKGGSLLVPALSSMVIYHETTNIFATLPFWLYTMLILCGITCIILFLKDRKKA